MERRTLLVMFKETTILIVLSRVIEFLGITAVMFLMFKGYKLKYVYIVGGVVLLSISVSLLGLFAREYFEYMALGDLLLTSAILGGLVYYVSRYPEKTKDFTPPDTCRCPVCGVQIIREDELCTMKIGNFTYYFDTCDHFVKLLQEVDFFLGRNALPRGKVKEVYVRAKDTGNWRRADRVYVVEEDGVYVAYEKLPKGKEPLDLEKLLSTFEDKLGRGQG